jgi:hypothetical protein
MALDFAKYYNSFLAMHAIWIVDLVVYLIRILLEGHHYDPSPEVQAY